MMDKSNETVTLQLESYNKMLIENYRLKDFIDKLITISETTHYRTDQPQLSATINDEALKPIIAEKVEALNQPGRWKTSRTYFGTCTIADDVTWVEPVEETEE